MARRRTPILVLVLLVVAGWRFVHFHKSTRPLGVIVQVTHPCSNEEALHQFGDDRYIIANFQLNGTFRLNETTQSQTSMRDVLRRIYETRDQRVLWFKADPTLEYGKVVGPLSQVASDTSDLTLIPITSMQLAHPVRIDPRTGIRIFDSDCVASR